MPSERTEPLTDSLTTDDAIAYADRVWREGPDRYEMDTEAVAALAVLADAARELRRRERESSDA